VRLTVASLWPLFLLALIPLVWWIRRRTATGLSERHLDLAAAVRSVVVLLLALALMRPIWQRETRALSVVYALDVSASIAPEFLDSAIGWMNEATEQGKPSHSRYLAFSDRTAAVAEPGALRGLPVTSDESLTPRWDAPLDRSETHLERALGDALSSFAPNRLKRLVLLTDGNQTAGDLGRALWRLREEGARVFVVPAPVRGGEAGDAFIEEIRVPEGVRAQEPVAIEVRVYSRKGTGATVALTRSGELLGQRRLPLRPGPNRVLFEVRLGQPGMTRLEASVEAAGDGFAPNNGLSRAFWVGPVPRVLYLEGRAESSSYLRRALEKEGIAVAVDPAARLPEGAETLGVFDAVILSDVARASLSEKSMAALKTYVRDGGGLLFAGGETSYGESGYSETAIEEILPVRFRVEEKKKDLALIVILDKSYSMLGPKIDLAKEAARAALDLLEPTHRFGVVTFNWDPYVTVSLQPVTEAARGPMGEEISRIQASGQTNIYPALKVADTQLLGTEAKVKHVILLSDGKSYPNDYQSLVSRMARDKITVSAVAVGEEADRELLANIARWGNGRSYSVEDARRVPQIFIEETRLAVQGTLVEEPFRATLKGSIEAFRGVDFVGAPRLRGYVSTEAKENAEVLLESPSQAPVLARWQYGLGKTVAFTSDVKNRWAVDWLSWPGYGKLWAQLVRETMRRVSPEEVDFRVERQGEEAVLSLSAVDADGRYRNGLRPEVEISGAKGAVAAKILRQVGPGFYQSRIPLSPDPAPLHFRLVDGIEDLEAPPPRTLSFPYADEYRLYHANESLLRLVSRETGGKYRPEIADVFADYGDRARVPTPLWPPLAMLALIGYLLDIAVRRAPWFWRRFESGARPTSAARGKRELAA